MSATARRDVLRPPANGFKAWLTACLMAYVPLGFRILRTIRPILRFGNTIVVTRYDDVREVFLMMRRFGFRTKTSSTSSWAGILSF